MQPSRRKPSVSKPSSVVQPGGLMLPMHAKLRGRVRWQVLDERGVPEVPRTPSGFAIAPIEGVEQPNLITNAGMDLFAAYSFRTFNPLQVGWRQWLRVGTGSIAPAFTDTALGNEAQDNNNSGSFSSGALTGELDTVTNEWVIYALNTRIVTMDADRNLTEFGFSPLRVTSSGDLAIRELFRDGVGTPITVSLLTGKSVRVDHTLEIRIPAPAIGNAIAINREEYDATNTLTATVPMNIVHGGWASANTDSAIAAGGLSSLAIIFDPSTPSPSGVRRIVNPWAYTRIGVPPGVSDLEPNTGQSSTLSGLGVLSAYTPGSHQRAKRWTVPPGSGNSAWLGAWVSSASAATVDGAWVILFDSPASYTKADTDELRFGLVSTWARA